jgi:hypothetical protein
MMSNVIAFRPRQRKIETGSNIIRKLINGEWVECVNVDALTPAQFAKYFSQENSGAPQHEEDHGAPYD